MFQVNYLNQISPKGTALWTKENRQSETIEDADALLVRSAAMHDMTFSENLLAVARAGAGVNNIPLDRCAEQGIVVFNTPGANARSVMELTLCGLLLGCRDVIGGINWVKSIAQETDVAKKVEKGKSQFAGHEILGQKLGVVGLGAVGGPFANAARKLGMQVYGCDPFISIDAAWHLDSQIHRVNSREEVFSTCDIISLHTPLVEDTRHMINAETIAKMKDGVRILNFARADLVNADDLKEALASGKVAAYVTDFPTEEVINVPGVVAIPHLGASTAESEDNCAVMAALELGDYIANGNIRNSVNFPAVSMPRSSDCRLCILHKNVPAMLNKFTAICAEQGINIENMTSKSRGDVAYTMLDVNGKPADSSVQILKDMEDVMRVRVL